MNTAAALPPPPPLADARPTYQAGMPNQAKLRISEVSKQYGSVFALQPSELDIAPGEFVTLLGPSGSGKTTLLMIIAGLVRPTSGKIWIDGRDATALQPYERDVGMMFQSYALFPHMTVGENIAFPLKMKRQSPGEIRRSVDEVLVQIRLPEVRNRFPSELSGGQQQRIALARSIVHRPSVVLMDEPLAALDKSLRTHMQSEIRALQQALGITVLYVTHDQEEAMTMSDRICLMNNARIEQIASPQDLYFAPKSIFAAGFLGESNRIDGLLESIDGLVGQVRVGDDRLTGTMVGSPRIGARCQMMVRPEAIQIVDVGAPSARNLIRGRVVSHAIGGATARTKIRTASGIELVCTRLTSRGMRAPTGDFGFSFDAADALIFGEAK